MFQVRNDFCHINLENNIPINQKPYRTAVVDQKRIDAQINDLLDQNLIRRSTSDYSFPVVLVNKKDDGEKSRLCVDFRKLNTITIPERYPMPNIKDIEDRLLGAKIFATLDISSGFHHIPVAEEDKRKTAFVTMHEHFEWNVMPFGLKNAPAIFQRIVYNILKRNGRQNSPKIGIQVIQNSYIFVYKRQNRIADMAPLDLPVEHNLADDGEINNHNNGEINNHNNGEINNHINGEIHNHINGEINNHIAQEEEQRRFDHWAARYVAHIIYWFQNGPLWIREDAARRLGLVTAQNPRMRELHEVRQFHVFRNGVVAPEFWEPVEMVNGHNPAGDNPEHVENHNGEQ